MKPLETRRGTGASRLACATFIIMTAIVCCCGCWTTLDTRTPQVRFSTYPGLYESGTAGVDWTLKVTANIFLSIKQVPFVGDIGKGWPFDIFHLTLPIDHWKLFEKEL